MKMFPQEYMLNKGESGYSQAETKVFQKLKDMPNTDDWVCFHSFRFIDVDSKVFLDKEIDFVLFIPKKGILFIEVKGGGIEYVQSEDQFYTTTRNGRRVEIKNPMKQVNEGKYALNEWLYKNYKVDSKDLSTFCVMFPDCTFDKNSLPPDYRDSNTLSEPDMNFLYDRIMNIFKCDLPSDKTLRINKIISRLEVKDVFAEMSFNSLINYNKKSRNFATDEQTKLVSFLELCPKAIINGVAGSGKTLLAINKATIMASQSKRVLYVCYTRQLSESIKKQYQDNYPQLDIYHYHSLAVRLLGDKFPRNPTDDDWNIHIPNLLQHVSERYDCIFVDEAQDFSESMLHSLLQLCDSDDSMMWLFGDTNQNIFKKDEGFLFTDFLGGNYVFPLSTNCRNSKNIAEYAYGYIPPRDEYKCYSDLGGKVYPYSRLSAEAQAEKIYQLVSGNNISFKNVIVITMNPKTKAEDASVFNTSFKNRFEVFNVNNQKPSGIPVTNIQNFKGMEKDIIILIDVSSETSAIDMYTASTRSTTDLHIFDDGTRPSQLSTTRLRSVSSGKYTDISHKNNNTSSKDGASPFGEASRNRLL